MKVESTVFQNNFGKYLKFAQANEEIIITKNGKDAAKLIACEDSIAESEAAYVLQDPHTTYEAFLELTESSEQRYELIDGEVYNLASPVYAHQHAIQGIFAAFYNHFKDKKCVPVLAPFDVTLIKHETNICVVQPDISVICDKDKINEEGLYKGVPTVVVEVLSLSTISKDMTKKLELYEQCGIKEYWIVDIKGRQIYLYLFDEKEIADNRVFLAGAHKYAESMHFEGLKVEIDDIFEQETFPSL